MQRVELAEESHRIYVNSWSEFIKGSQKGEVIGANGLTLASSRSSWPGLNLAFLQSPIQSEGELSRRVRFGAEFFEERQLRWLFVLHTEWTQTIDPRKLNRSLSDCGLYLIQEVVGMWVDQVSPPRRKDESHLSFKPLQNDEVTQKDFARINADANRIPDEWTEEAVLGNSVWNGAASGYVGYQRGEPVTAAMALRSGGSDFVGWVATRPMFQKSGFGEAILRHTIAQSRANRGAAPVMLHATADGLSLYRRLGFTECARFQLYLGGKN